MYSVGSRAAQPHFGDGSDRRQNWPTKLDKIKDLYSAVRSGDVTEGRVCTVRRKHVRRRFNHDDPAGILCPAREPGWTCWLRFLRWTKATGTFLIREGKDA